MIETNMFGLCEAMFVMWFSPNCGHCHRLRPTFESVARQFSQHIETISVVLIDATIHRELAGILFKVLLMCM